ncbi:MAG: PTS glucose transporter subunit IIA [Erysipelotrichaceae bacterium]
MREFASPAKGKCFNIEKFPDEIIAEKTMGDGYGMFLTGNRIVAPFDCEVKVVCPGGHAMCLEDRYGLQIMIHIGVETYKIQGMNKVHKKVGKRVKKGDLLITTDINKLQEKTGNTATAIVFLSGEKITLLKDDEKIDYLEEDFIRIERK